MDEMNEALAWSGLKIQTNVEYSPEGLKDILARYAEAFEIDTDTFVYGKGHRKSIQQRHYEKLQEYIEKLKEYIEKVEICGPDRNSYSKTDHSATFMRTLMPFFIDVELSLTYRIYFFNSRSRNMIYRNLFPTLFSIDVWQPDEPPPDGHSGAHGNRDTPLSVHSDMHDNIK
ncbi:hypothetical protein ABXS75_04010 [Roseburia hominis]